MSTAQAQTVQAEPSKAPVVDAASIVGAIHKEAADPAAPVATTPPEANPKEDVSRELAILHRERKKLEAKQKEAAERLKRLEEYEAKKAKAKEDPYPYLSEAGLTLDELVQRKLKEGEPLTPEEQAKALDEKVNKTVEERIREHEEKKQKEAEQIRMKEDIDSFRASMVKEVTNGADRYELISAYDAIDTAMMICAQAIQEKPEAYPTREDAEKLIPRVLEMLEAQLLDETNARLSKSKKVKTLLGVEEKKPEDTPKPGATVIPAPQTTTTVVSQSAAPASPEQQSGRLLSREDSIKQLAAKLQAQWESKK